MLLLAKLLFHLKHVEITSTLVTKKYTSYNASDWYSVVFFCLFCFWLSFFFTLFCVFFLGHLRETDMKEIPIHIKEEDAFEQIIDYFYTSKLDINQSNVQKLIIVAGLLQLRKVQQACCDFVKRKITSENCLGKKFQSLNNNM